MEGHRSGKTQDQSRHCLMRKPPLGSSGSGGAGPGRGVEVGVWQTSKLNRGIFAEGSVSSELQFDDLPRL